MLLRRKQHWITKLRVFTSGQYFSLTSYKEDSHHELKDAVDKGKCKHDLQFGRIEGQLDNGATQLGVLKTSLQSNRSTPGWGEKKCNGTAARTCWAKLKESFFEDNQVFSLLNKHSPARYVVNKLVPLWQHFETVQINNCPLTCTMADPQSGPEGNPAQNQ